MIRTLFNRRLSASRMARGILGPIFPARSHPERCTALQCAAAGGIIGGSDSQNGHERVSGRFPISDFRFPIGLVLTIFGLIAVIGCARVQPSVHGIPNFGVVVGPMNGQPGIYRGGEPTKAGNTYLKSLGVTRQVKLNNEPDDASAAQFEIIQVEISTGEQIFGNDLDRKIPAAAAAIVPGTFLHCTHGKNRTGTVIGYYRLLQGATKQQAMQEMLRYGWGDSLPGLKWYWRTLPDPISREVHR